MSLFVFIAGSSSFESQKMERPSLNVLSPSSPGMLQDAPQLMPGQLSVSPCALTVICCSCVFSDLTSELYVYIFPVQVKLWYDKAGHQLIVNVLQAVELPLRPDGRPRSPYVKMYFLPDRRYSNYRFTGIPVRELGLFQLVAHWRLNNVPRAFFVLFIIKHTALQ